MRTRFVVQGSERVQRVHAVDKTIFVETHRVARQTTSISQRCKLFYFLSAGIHNLGRNNEHIIDQFRPSVFRVSQYELFDAYYI